MAKRGYDRDTARSEAKELIRMASNDPAIADMAADSWAELTQQKQRAVRRRNQAEGTIAKAENGTRLLGAVLIATPLFYFNNYLYGKSKRTAAELVADWEEQGSQTVGASLEQYPEPWDYPEGVRDPRTYFGFLPKTLAWTIAWGLAAGGAELLGRALKRPPGNMLTRGFGFASLFNLVAWGADFFQSLGSERALRQMQLAPGGQQAA